MTAVSAGDAPKTDDSKDRPGWKLVWSDEFDYEGVPDPKKWGYETGFVRNGEMQFYTNARSENARVENGNLIIEARKEHFPNPKYDANNKGTDWNKIKSHAEYTSASLTTEKFASWTYGRIEVKAKIPTGRGTWPAIWMLGTNIHEPGVGWPKCGEIDILENVGFDPDGIHTTVHTGAYNHVKKTAKGHREELKKPFDDFHIYAIEWTKKAIDFFLDDKKVFSFENDGKGDVNTWPYDKPQYLILNFAVGGGWGGVKGIDDSIFPQKFVIKYARVYQQVEEKKE
jgi:beta-glucanase (GH16 family)